jgi:hypothetical protein
MLTTLHQRSPQKPSSWLMHMESCGATFNRNQSYKISDSRHWGHRRSNLSASAKALYDQDCMVALSNAWLAAVYRRLISLPRKGIH